MKPIIDVQLEDYGNIRLENCGGYYRAEDENGNYLGDIYPEEVEGWTEDDATILSAIVEDLIDDGTLEMPEFEAAYCTDFED